MPEKPIIIFPASKHTERSRRPAPRPSIIFPTPAQQQQRLDAKFRRIISSFSQVQTGMIGLDPERVIVLEAVGDVANLAKAAEKVVGLEWLAEIDQVDADPADGFAVKGQPEAKLPVRLFALMTNQQAGQQLIGLWKLWAQNPTREWRRGTAGYGFGPFKSVFKQLRDVRLWGPRDRLLDTGALEQWRESVDYGIDPVRFQADLWCRRTDADRSHAYGKFNALIRQFGGECIRQRSIPEIAYHGVLLDLPRARIAEAIDRVADETYTELLRCDEVMFFRPSAQMASPISNDVGIPLDGGDLDARPLPAGLPVVALFDGCPLENHIALANRLWVEDPDGLAARYVSGQQQHGTAMASLITHGDLSGPGDPLPRPVYVRPIFVPYADFQNRVSEAVPDDQLVVDVIERAVRRLFEGEGNEPAVAPTVRVINLSIGDASLPFSREISPLARLVDWLAWKYNVLFIVSAGNQLWDLTLGCTRAELGTKTDQEVFHLAFRAMLEDQSLRRPFSPAEAINGVTVGAVHADQSGDGAPVGYRCDPFGGRRMPSPISTVSRGFRRAVKPEILMEGGRQLYQELIRGNQAQAILTIHSGKIAPGQRVAAPGPLPGELNKTVYCRGTSNATALASRTAGMIYERLALLADEPGGDRLSEDWMAVLLKVLLVHGASWGDAAGLIEEAAPPGLDGRALESLKTRMLGYGEAEPTRSLASTEKRVLLLGWDTISADDAHEYILPLPPSLASRRYKRRLTITLAWMTPANLRHRAYRQAALALVLPAPILRETLGVKTCDADRNESARGTTQHMVFEGEDAVPFVDGAELTLKVNCRSDAGTLDTAVRYALAVTLEIADPVQVDIYTEIRDRVRARALVPAVGT